MTVRAIRSERPLIYTWLWDGCGADDIRNGWEMLPPALRRCFAFICRADRKVLAQAAKIGAPVIVPADVDGRTDTELLKGFPCIVGLCGAEYPDRFGWPGIPRILEATEGGGPLVLWQFLFHFGRLLDADPARYDFYRRHRDRIVLEIKANGFPEWWQPAEDGAERLGRFVHYAEYMFGAWLTGAVGSWGFHPEIWQWYETGYYSRLFDWSLPGTRFRCELADRGMYNTAFHNVGNCGYPENLMALELLNVAIHGCAVFSFEHGLGSGIDRCAVLPLLEEVVRRKMIPSREEALRRVRAAVYSGQPTEPARNRPGAFWPDSFRKLYATASVFMQNDGRYGLIPCLPRFTPPEERKRFECFPTGYRYQYLPFLNALYPKEGRGRCFIERHGRRWYVFNPHENVDREADFHLPLFTNRCRELSGRLGSHCLAIVEETPDRIEVFLSNFRQNKDEWWERRHEILMGDPFADVDGLLRGTMSREEGEALARATRDEIRRRLDSRPAMNDARATTIALTGHAGARPPRLEISGHEGFRHRERWDAARRRYELVVLHNGVVRLSLRAAGAGRPRREPRALSANLALDRPATASSAQAAHPPGAAVDGLLETGWSPAGRGAQWLTVDLTRKARLTACKFAGESAGGRGATAMLQLADSPSGPWRPALRAKLVGRFFFVRPLVAARAVRWVRLFVRDAAAGFVLRELGVYSGPNRELKRLMPLVEPKSAAELLAVLRAADSGAERSAAEDAIADYCAGGRHRPELAGVMARALAGAGAAPAASIVRILGRLGGRRALSIVRNAAADPRAEVREAAQWALTAWADPAPIEELLHLARSARDLSLRSAALRRLLTIVGSGSLPAATRDAIVAEGVALAVEGRDRLAWVDVARGAANVETLRAVEACMDDRLASPWLLAPARRASVEISERLAHSHPRDVRRVLLHALGTRRDGGYRSASERARAILARVMPPDQVPQAPSQPRPPAPRPAAGGPPAPGIRYAVFEPTGESLGEVRFEELAPLAEHVSQGFPPRGFLSSYPGSGLWVRFDGLLRAPCDGDYVVSLRADAEAVLRVAGREVVCGSGHDGLAEFHFAQGMHPIQVVYRRGPLELVSLRWQPPAVRQAGAAAGQRPPEETGEGTPFPEIVSVMERVPPDALWHYPLAETATVGADNTRK